MVMSETERWQRFADALRRQGSPPFKVQLWSSLEPRAVVFSCEWPDRLWCGCEAFDALRARGFDVAVSDGGKR